MTHASGRVHLVCVTCEQDLLIATAPMTRLHASLGSFFGEHEDCQTTIDLSARKAAASYQFVQANILQRDLRIDDAAVLRKWVERARREIEMQLEKCCRHSPNIHDVIESGSWRGYRLNPAVRVISLTELGPATSRHDIS